MSHPTEQRTDCRDPNISDQGVRCYVTIPAYDSDDEAHTREEYRYVGDTRNESIRGVMSLLSQDLAIVERRRNDILHSLRKLEEALTNG